MINGPEYPFTIIELPTAQMSDGDVPEIELRRLLWVTIGGTGQLDHALPSQCITRGSGSPWSPTAQISSGAAANTPCSVPVPGAGERVHPVPSHCTMSG
jgi:hypothetical protein